MDNLRLSKIIDQDFTDFFEFVKFKCENADQPFSITRVSDEFRKISGSGKSTSCFKQRFTKYRSQLESRIDLDLKTKVKQMYALGASISLSFIRELQENANLEVDDRNRIVKYESFDGSLILEKEQKDSNRMREGKDTLDRELLHLVQWNPVKKEEEDEEEPSGSQPSRPNKRQLFHEILCQQRFDESSQMRNKKANIEVPNEMEINQESIEPNGEISQNTHRKFMESIQDLFVTLDLSIPKEMQIKIEKSIRNVHEMKTKEIKTAVNACILIASKCVEPKDDEEFKSLQNLLLLLRNVIVSTKLSVLNEIEQELKKRIRQLSIQDKVVLSIRNLKKRFNMHLESLSTSFLFESLLCFYFVKYFHVCGSIKVKGLDEFPVSRHTPSLHGAMLAHNCLRNVKR